MYGYAMLDRRETPNCSLACRTSILISSMGCSENRLLSENSPAALLFEVCGFGTNALDTRLLAFEDLLALEVTTISEHRHLVLADCIAGLVGHR